MALALRHSAGPNFARSLEWLLFTSLEADAASKSVSPIKVRPPPSHFWDVADMPTGGVPESASKDRQQAGPLLIAAATLIRHFAQVHTSQVPPLVIVNDRPVSKSDDTVRLVV